MTQNFNIPLHSIIVTVAPSGSGKSFFSKNNLIPSLTKNKNVRVKYLSSDDIRRELIGKDLHKHDPEMLQVSEQAFKKLYNEIEFAASFPLKYEYIIVDTTGMSTSFRKHMIQLGQKLHYNTVAVLFDFKERSDYYKYNTEDPNFDTMFLNDSIKRFRTTVLPTIKKDGFSDIFKIKEKEFNNYEITVKNINEYNNCFIDNNNETIVISDVHGCLDELKELLLSNSIEIDVNDKIVTNKNIVLVGDIVDKGKDILNTIRFIYKNMDKFKMIIGNHENYVYKAVSGKISNRDIEVENNFFETVKLLEDPINSNELRMFVEIYNNMVPFVQQNNKFIAVHAPCSPKYVGKLDSFSKKQQRNLRYTKNEGDLDAWYAGISKDLAFVQKETIYNSLPIICGHIMVTNVNNINNMWFIDTGCVSGGHLSSISFDRYKPFIKKVKSKEINKQKEFLDISFLFDKKINTEYISYKDLNRIKYAIEDKVNFISGTVSPSPKDTELNVLESFNKGLDYYANNGVEEVIIQPKYMGSRANIYLFNDYTKSYAVTRNGYKIKQINLIDEFKKLRDKLDHLFINGEDLLILDAELLPWRVLGDTLVDNTFVSINNFINNEYEFLKENGFYNQLSELSDKIEMTDFIKDKNVLSKKEMVDKYQKHIYRTFNSYLDIKDIITPVDDFKRGIDVFGEQIDIFGANSNVEIKCFNILKIVNSDQSEYIPTNNLETFSSVGDGNYCVVNFKNKTTKIYYNNVLINELADDNYSAAENYYKYITENNKMEGVVIKPVTFNLPIRIAPYIKVRNENYLHIVYGFDYKKPNKYKTLIKKKNISNKIKSSITEFNLGIKMLKNKYSELNQDNNEYKSLIAKFITEEQKQLNDDPRL